MQTYQNLRLIIIELAELRKYVTDGYAYSMLAEAIDNLSEAYTALRESLEQDTDPE